MNEAKAIACAVALALGNLAVPAGAQVPMPSNNGGAALRGAAPLPPSSTPAGAPTRKKFVFDLAEYTREHPDLTQDQLRIGFALATIDRAKRDKERASTLALIKRTHDSLDFRILENSEVTPLDSAAGWGESELVAAILAKGVAVDGPADRKTLVPPLVSAVSSADQAFRSNPLFPSPERILETIRVLLKAGANPNVKISTGATPLGTALWLTPTDAAGERIKVAIVKALLDSGATPEQLPLVPGASSDSEGELTALLIQHGLNATANDSRLLAEAVHNRRREVVRQLLTKGADPNARALVMPRRVVADADVETAKLLLAWGANPNVCSEEDANGKCTSHGQPLIFGAAADPEFFHLAVVKGADPNIADGQNQTALGYALTYRTAGERGIRKICVAGTAQCIDAIDPFNRTVAVRLLLDAGADPNKRTEGVLPLMLAADGEHEVITMLLDKGAHMEAQSVEGEQIGPISQAIASRRPFLANELLRRTKGKLGPDERWALYAAASEGKQDLAEALIQHGVDVNARGPIGETALHHAAWRGNAEMVRRLLAMGADPNAQTDTMPMEINLPYGLVPSRSYLEPKFRIYAATGLSMPGLHDGRLTPLMLAVGPRNVAVAQALLDGGAKTEIRSQRGLTARDIANIPVWNMH